MDHLCAYLSEQKYFLKIILSEVKRASRLLKINAFVLVALRELLMQFKVYSHKLML